VGTRLFSANGKYEAQVRADGSLVSGAISGSIHQVGAKVQNAEACNGWTFWHFKTPQGLTQIDALRSIIRSEMGETA